MLKKILMRTSSFTSLKYTTFNVVYFGWLFQKDFFNDPCIDLIPDKALAGKPVQNRHRKKTHKISAPTWHNKPN